MTREELESKLEGMKQKLAIMEWDLNRDQLNPAMKMKYQKLKGECEQLEQEIKSMPEEKKEVKSTSVPSVPAESTQTEESDSSLPLQGVVQ